MRRLLEPAARWKDSGNIVSRYSHPLDPSPGEDDGEQGCMVWVLLYVDKESGQSLTKGIIRTMPKLERSYFLFGQ